MKNINYVIAGLLFLSLFSCRKTEMVPGTSDQHEALAKDGAQATGLNAGGFISNPHNLNIVYFVPNDNPALPDYKTRLSELMIYFQNFVKSEMNRNGFGDMTFGLSYDPTTQGVKFIEVPGAEGQADYPYNASISAAKILNEIANYKALHPGEFSNSHHMLIILPQRTDGQNSQPFYGYGKNCFAVDNEHISVEDMSTTTSSLIGGMLHELGHGLNLPHDHAKVSEQSALGTSLMASGNYTFGKSPTFLTFGDCSILSKNEVFQPTAGGPYYGSATTSYKISQFYYDNTSNSLVIGGRYTSSLPSEYNLVYLDPLPSAINQDYDAINWSTTMIGSDSFRITAPLDELFTKGNAGYAIYSRLVLDNGSVITSPKSTFRFVNNIPMLNDTAFLYQNSYYGGYSRGLSYGSYTTSELAAKGIANNDISSVNLPVGVRVKLFDGDNFTGSSMTLNNSSDFLSSFNDKTSSALVLPNAVGNPEKAIFYKHCSYGGYAVTLGIGGYTTADLTAAGILNNDVSSIKVPAGLKVILYDSDYFKGTSRSFTADNSCLVGVSFNDKTSSILIVPAD